MATAGSISRICGDKLTFYETITDFTTPATDNDILIDLIPTWNTVDSIAATPIMTFTTPNTGAGATDVVLRGVHTPELANDAANKAYVDGLAITGVSWKNTVHAATTAAIAVFPPTDAVTTNVTIDGVTLAVGDRILIKDQGDATNGIYIISPDTVAWARAPDVPNDAEAAGFAVWVDDGTDNGDKGFVVTNNTGSDVVNTDTLVWANFSSAAGVAGIDGDIQLNLNGGHNVASNGSLNWNDTVGQLTVTGGTGNISLSVAGGRLDATGGITVPTAATNVALGDVVTLGIGNSNDYAIVHNSGASGNTTVTSITGDLQNINSGGNTLNSNTTGLTVNRMGDTLGATSVSYENSDTTELWKIDSLGGITHTLGSYTLLDTIPLNVGTGSDLVISHDGTNSSVVNSTGELRIQQSITGSNLVIENTTATAGDGIDFKLAALDTGSSFSFIGDSAGTPVTLMEIVAASQDSTSFTTGTVRITGGLAVTQDVTAVCVNMLSDATTKTNIQPFTDGLSKLKQIEGFNYNFLPGYGSNDRMNTGVLAQQIETISGLEHCVTTDTSSGYKSVNYTFLIPMMIEGMKELANTVEKLTDKIKELEQAIP